ncbi:hypothetical protein DSO57_1003533 [Entomophthora muscae]|uniref:Uncharacterized protein n=1 Tax=Entomophthora muscae TaxID=34485 RepID=A0ACC2SB32_9FUNG|nr:hypothetical protein DSO57_1003533 [Entomophthora muscae]
MAAPATSTDQPMDPLPTFFCPLGAPFEPVHFTKYPPNPAYSEFTLENILLSDPLARTRVTKTISHEGKWYTVLPTLFCDKYNYLPTYLVPMSSPSTPKTNFLQEFTTINDTTSTQMFGVLYITLTCLVDSMVLNSGPWALLGCSLSYIIKLAPILWWVLPSVPPVPPPVSNSVSTNNWHPDTKPKLMIGRDTKILTWNTTDPYPG